MTEVRTRSVRSPHLAVAAILAAAVGCAPPPPIIQPVPELGDVPSPLSGPGVPRIDQTDRSAVQEGWNRLLTGDAVAARAAVGAIEALPAARLLLLQSEVVGDDPGRSVDGLRELVSEEPGYAAAWASLSTAAERSGQEAVALRSARRTADLWDRDTWRSRADDLYARWVEDRMIDATDRLASGKADGALELVRRVEELDPDRTDARMLEARALIALGRPTEADDILHQLTDEPAAVALSAELAEQRGDLLTALDRYSELPDSWQGRDQSIERVKRAWRRTVLPAYVQQALTSPGLSRGQLAAVLVALAPQLGPLEGGAVPLLTDIVDEPMQREIITVVRLGLMSPDPLEPRFLPERPVSAAEARTTLERAAHLLGWSEPVWCAGSVLASGCIELSEPVSGEAVERAIERLAGGGPR